MSGAPAKTFTAIFAGITITLAAAMLVAQTSPPAPVKRVVPAKPLPVVTIKKLDGTVVRGQITSAEPDQLVLKAPRAAAEAVTVRWSQIARVSNGLTQEEAASSGRRCIGTSCAPTATAIAASLQGLSWNGL